MSGRQYPNVVRVRSSLLTRCARRELDRVTAVIAISSSSCGEVVARWRMASRWRRGGRDRRHRRQERLRQVDAVDGDRGRARADRRADRDIDGAIVWGTRAGSASGARARSATCRRVRIRRGFSRAASCGRCSRRAAARARRIAGAGRRARARRAARPRARADVARAAPARVHRRGVDRRRRSCSSSTSPTTASTRSAREALVELLKAHCGRETAARSWRPTIAAYSSA